MIINFCEFPGDDLHDWDEAGFKKKCEHLGFTRCTLHNAKITEDSEGWRMCCAECTTPVYSFEDKHD